jgi:branched-chain amino acid transport system substrate-binding protein
MITGIALTALWAGCGGGSSVKIGAVLPLTGPWSLYGEPIRDGIELAYDELAQAHRSGTYPVALELDMRDSQSQPQKAAELMRQLAGEGAVAVVGGITSAEALTMIEVANRVERVLLSPSASSPSLSGQGRYFFRIFPSDFLEGTRLGSFAALKLELKNALIITANNTFARGISGVFQTEFERYDGKIWAEVVYPEGTTDFAPFVQQALSTSAPRPGEKLEAIFIADFADEVRQILSQLRQQGFAGRVLTTSAFAAPEVIQTAGRDAEEVVLAQTDFDPASQEPKVKAFVDAFEAKYGEKPGLFAAHGYDAFKVFAQVLAKNPIPSNLWSELRGMGDGYNGVTGQIQFDEKGDVAKYPRVYLVQNGTLIDYDAHLEELKREIDRKRQQLFQELERLRRQRSEGGGASP